MQNNLSRAITSGRYKIFSWSFFILKITLRFIQPLKKVKLCKIAHFPLTNITGVLSFPFAALIYVFGAAPQLTERLEEARLLYGRIRILGMKDGFI